MRPLFGAAPLSPHYTLSAFVFQPRRSRAARLRGGRGRRWGGANYRGGGAAHEACPALTEGLFPSSLWHGGERKPNARDPGCKAWAPPHNSRLGAQAACRAKIFRDIFQKCSPIRQGLPALFGSSHKKFFGTLHHLGLCGVALELIQIGAFISAPPPPQTVRRPCDSCRWRG